MRARILLGVAIAAGAILLGVSPAAAQPYPPEPPVLTVSDPVVVIGEGFLLTGEGFGDEEEVLIETEVAPLAAPMVGVDESTQEEIAMVPASRTLPESAGLAERLGSAVAAAAGPVPPFTVTTNAAGGFTTPIKLVDIGIVTITATGLESGLTASVVVTVLPKQKHAHLPETGSGDVWRLVRVGGAGIIAGGVLLLGGLAWRARRERVDA